MNVFRKFPQLARLRRGNFLGILSLILLATQSVSAFSDISGEDPDREIFGHLRDVGIMTGTEGNFRPADFVTRAQGLTIALRAGGIQIPRNFDITNLPNDVDPNVWYAASIARAQSLGLVKRNSAEFFPERTVTKAEFLAMLLKASQANLKPFFTQTNQLANDVKADDWFDPIFRYAKKYHIAHISAENLYHPHRQMTRREVAVLTFRNLRIFHGDEATKDFIEMQSHIDEFMKMVQSNQSDRAMANLQAIIQLSRRITLKKNNENAVAALSLSRSFENLVRSMRAVRNGKNLTALEELHLAANHAERAAQKSESMAPVANEVAKLIDETLRKFS